MIFQVGCIINTKLPSVFTAGALKALVLQTMKTSWMYGGLYQHTHMVLYMGRIRFSQAKVKVTTRLCI